MPGIASLLPEVRRAVALIADRLYFVPFSRPPPHVCLPAGHSLLCVDELLSYQPFYSDFGPLHLGCTVRFCSALDQALADPSHVVYVHCNNLREAKSNAAVLVGIYQVLCMQRSAAEAYEHLKAFEPYTPFRDASIGPHTYKLSPAHCICAFAMALRVGLFSGFLVDEYEHFEHVENGDLNVVVPQRFLAFASPSPPPPPSAAPRASYSPFTPNDYLPIFRHFHVRAVIRLNQSSYSPLPFTAHGIRHVDLVFADGSNPTPAIVQRFLAVCDEQEERGGGVIAVHCKAGLGRTGSLLGCWLMREYSMKACEAIAWLRLCRPGSVIGDQQHWLDSMQEDMWKEGRARRARRCSAIGVPPSPARQDQDGPVAELELHDAKTGDEAQSFVLPSHHSPAAALSLGVDHQANGLLAVKALRVGKGKAKPAARDAGRSPSGAPVHPMTTRLRRGSGTGGGLGMKRTVRLTRSAAVSPAESPKLNARTIKGIDKTKSISRSGGCSARGDQASGESKLRYAV